MSLLTDAVRPIVQRPAAYVLVVLSLALGAGGAGALFTAYEALELRTLPVRDPARLVGLGTADEAVSEWSGPVWSQLRRTQALAGVAAWARTRLAVDAGSGSTPAEVMWSSGELFGVLGLDAALGRVLSPADDVRGGGASGPVAVISDRYWRTRFAGAADVLGRSILVEGVGVTIVGVTPPSFSGLWVGVPFDVALPVSLETSVERHRSALDDPYGAWLMVLGRLAPGDDVSAATARMRAAQSAIRAATLPEFWRAEEADSYLTSPWILSPAARGTTSLADRYRKPLTAVLVVSSFVYLMACLNVGSLLSARAAERQRAWSLRLLLGARASDLWGAMLIESLLLGVVSVACGALLAHPMARLLVSQLSTAGYALDVGGASTAPVALYMCALAFVTVALAGAGPLVRVLRTNAWDAAVRPSAAPTPSPSGGILVAIQVGVSVVLLVVAGLFVRTLGALEGIDLGFDPRPVLVARIDTGRAGLEVSERRGLFERALSTAKALPGVDGAALSVAMPVSNRVYMARVVVGEQDAAAATAVHLNRVGPGWFEVVGTHVQAGRAFGSTDPEETDAVVVNEAFARRVLRTDSPLGRSLRLVEGEAQRPGPILRVVGVVADTAYRSARATVPPTLYLPFRSVASVGDAPELVELSVKARASSELPRLESGLAAALRSPNSAVSVSVRPWAHEIGAVFNPERLASRLGAFFASLALLLTCVGLFGVTTQAVTARRREIGVRVAVGASRAAVARQFLNRTARPVLTGLTLGALASVWARTLVASQLYGVDASDPGVLGTAAALLVVVSLAGTWWPVRGACRLDPMQVLREP